MRRHETDINQALPLLLVTGFAATALTSSLTTFGLWDPWELNVAERARAIAGGDVAPAHDAIANLVAVGFQWLGVTEWAGRLPGALGGLLAIAIAYGIGAHVDRPRTGVYAAVATGSTPLFILNALPIGGQALGFALQGGVVLAGMRALLGTPTHLARCLWLALLASCSLGCVLFFGALHGVLPPLLALAATGLLVLQASADRSSQTVAIHREHLPELHRPTLALLTGLTALVTAGVVRAIYADPPDYSFWTGGQAGARTVPAFDVVLERVFHSLAPFSAILPLALAAPLVSPRERPLPWAGILCALWCVAGYGTQTLFLARYGDQATFLPVIGAGLLVALWLTVAEQRNASHPFAAVVTVFFCGLLIRDFALYPTAPLAGLPIIDLQVPKVFNPKQSWSLILGLFACCTTLACATNAQARSVDLLAPYRLLRAQFHRDLPTRLWLIVLSLGLVTLLATSALSLLTPPVLPLNSLGRRIFQGLGVGILALAPIIACTQILLGLYSHLGHHRFVPLAASGAMVGLFVAHIFLPALSGHLSPRAVFETFNRLAGPEEALATYKLGSRAATYYADGEVLQFTELRELQAHFNKPGRRWAALHYEDLPKIDSEFRRKHHHHLYVVDVHSGALALVATQPIDNIENQNPFLDGVRAEAPEQIQHPVLARFDDKLELLGYDVEARHADYATVGETITLTWYFRVLKHMPSDYKVFLHIDGRGTRINGDHDPLSGQYEMRLWAPGDVIADRHEVKINATSPAGRYQMMMGFFSGRNRLKVTAGPMDDADRVKAGALQIR